MNRPRGLALLFGLFLILVVILADQGQVKAVFGFLYNFPYGDKVGHFGLYGILAFLLSLSFLPVRVRVLALKPLRSSLILAGIVTLEEISQAFFPTRRADPLDLAASLAGIFLLSELGAILRNQTWLQRWSLHG
jgi:polysaccharide biosynthesis protein VpsQ